MSSETKSDVEATLTKGTGATEDASAQFSDVKMATILSGKTNPRGIPYVAFIESARRVSVWCFVDASGVLVGGRRRTTSFDHPTPLGRELPRRDDRRHGRDPHRRVQRAAPEARSFGVFQGGGKTRGRDS